MQQALNTFKASVIVDDHGSGGDVQYPIGFTILKENTDNPSVMYDYVEPTSGKLTIIDGKKYVSFTLKQSAEILSFKTKLNANSPLAETSTINSDTAANKRTVEFEVEDLTKKVDGWVKIYWELPPPIGIYDHEYNVQIAFSDLPPLPDPANKTALNTLIADAQTRFAAAVEGTESGQYPSVSKAALLEAVTAAQAAAANSAATQQQVDEAVTALQAAITAFMGSVNTGGGPVTVNKAILKAAIADAQAKYDEAVEGTELGQYLAGAKNKFKTSLDTVKAVSAYTEAAQAQVDEAVQMLLSAVKLFESARFKEAVTVLPDGEYSLELNIFTSGTEQLAAVQDYVQPNSGKLLVEGGKKYVFFTLNQAEEVSSFQTQLNSVSALAEAGMTGKDEAAHTRSIEFEVEDLLINKQNGLVKLITSDAQEKNYEVQIGYGKIRLDLTKPVKDGLYNVSFISRSDDPAASPINDFIQAEGSSLTVQNGKKQAAFKLQTGVTLSEILLLNADGTTNKVITPTYSAKQMGLVRALADEPAAQTVQFEVADDLTATYAIGLVKGDQQVSLKLGFGTVEPVTSMNVITPIPDEPITTIDPGNGNNQSSRSHGSSGGGAVVSTLQDGKYSVNYVINNADTEQQSILQNYVITPALLTVAGDKKVVSIRLKQSEEIQSLQTELNGAWNDVLVISEDQVNHTRDVQFEINSLSSKLKARAHINSDEIDAEITFDAAGAQKVSDDARLTGGQQEGQASGSVPTVQAPTDIENHWAKALIERAVGLGIVNGYEDGTFRPDGEVSRIEFTALVSRALKLEGSGAALNFADLSKVPDWAKSDLEKAVASGIITSYEDNTFRPERSINRSEIAVIVVRALNLPLDPASTVSFADTKQIPDWAYAQVAAAFKKGIINGRDNNMFAPDANATRAEAVKLILSLLDEMK